MVGDRSAGSVCVLECVDLQTMGGKDRPSCELALEWSYLASRFVCQGCHVALHRGATVGCWVLWRQLIHRLRGLGVDFWRWGSGRARRSFCRAGRGCIGVVIGGCRADSCCSGDGGSGGCGCCRVCIC